MQWAKAGDFEGKEAEKAEKDTHSGSRIFHSAYILCIDSETFTWEGSH